MDGRHKGHKPSEAARKALQNHVSAGLGKSREQREMELTEAFLRPPYQYTSIVNRTIEKLHENDYLKKKSIYER